VVNARGHLQPRHRDHHAGLLLQPPRPRTGPDVPPAPSTPASAAADCQFMGSVGVSKRPATRTCRRSSRCRRSRFPRVHPARPVCRRPRPWSTGIRRTSTQRTGTGRRVRRPLHLTIQGRRQPRALAIAPEPARRPRCGREPADGDPGERDVRTAAGETRSRCSPRIRR